MKQDSATYKFFSIYNMLYRRKSNVRIINLGYGPILTMLEYIKYEHIYDNMTNKYDYKKHYEENIEVDCDALTGIRILYINDPVNCLRTLFERGKIDKTKIYSDTISLTGKAAYKNHLKCFIFLKEKGCQTNDFWAYIDAAAAGNLEFLKYLYKNGHKWHWNFHNDVVFRYNHDNWACEAAATGGHLTCLTYLHAIGCSWSQSTCYHAAQNGHLNCLKYAIENGCPYDIKKLDTSDKACQNYINSLTKPCCLIQ